ncbi:NAD(P)-binding protein [Cryphonectria parasitica EP155]|uniref:NAD(P)-binding protein n=1 Tax=Cryphonectria parasitica (strain ATCC 38755 / EP155) TaxID=660469 RepID=A0A9P4XUS8_CRYP1|nr:NAD(P)-binding protein [Cryphonectria parasitica EP155]KAF3761384.1 NAD(P)-binding protein [Cryphonectria parasitica EP155]
MSDFVIQDQDLVGLKDKVVIVTGSSSGIGLATTQLLLSLGAKVVGADVSPPKKPLSSPSYTHHETDASSWADLLALFKAIKARHGRIDHVFANAGIGPAANYFPNPDGKPGDDEHDENGDPLEPSQKLYNLNLNGAINTATLGIYYLRMNEVAAETETGSKGSVVITCSIASLQRFGGVDYCASKHGVFGFMRAMRQQLIRNDIPIRINGLAPSWTRTGMPPKAMYDLGIETQPAEVVARAAALLMADEKRHGELLYVAKGKVKEIDEAVLMPTYYGIVGGRGQTEDDDFARMLQAEGGKYIPNS